MEAKELRMKMNYPIVLVLMVFGLFIAGCEEPYTPPSNDKEPDIVVEGYVEVGDEALPVFVILTKTLPYTTEFSPETLAEIFVRNAIVTVSDGNTEVQLEETCLSDLPPEIAEEISDRLGLLPNFGDYCVYIDIEEKIDKRIGGTYDLNIEADSKTLTATTTVPELVPITNWRFDDPPSAGNDTMAQLIITLTDPEETDDYYRYATGILPGPPTPGLSTVFDDYFFNGRTFDFPLQGTQRADEEFDINTFGLFNRGDSVVIWWTNLDEDHFNFWNTLEYNSNNQGPFSTYTRVDFNINGGIGIWGGYAQQYIFTYVPE